MSEKVPIGENASSAEVYKLRYREEVESSYGLARRSYHRLDQFLPGFDLFADQIETLEAAYSKMDKMGWGPEIIFVPQGLPYRQWHELLMGYPVSKFSEQITQGIKMSPHYEYVNDINAPRPGLFGWKVAVINSSPYGGKFSEISPHNTENPEAQEALRQLRDYGVSGGMSDVAVIEHFTPTLDAYLALQLRSLAQNSRPIDSTGWTLAKEIGAERNPTQWLTVFCLGENIHISGRSDFGINGGVRPAISA